LASAELTACAKAIALAQGSAVQGQRDMNRNRLGDELGETNKYAGSELTANSDYNRFLQHFECNPV